MQHTFKRIYTYVGRTDASKSIYIVGTNVIGAPDMVAMLRLGQKYGFEKFKKGAHKQLRTIYPRSLQELDFILDESDESSHSNSQLRLVPVGDEFNILKTILELHIETVLPMAYYFCVRNRSLVRLSCVISYAIC